MPGDIRNATFRAVLSTVFRGSCVNLTYLGKARCRQIRVLQPGFSVGLMWRWPLTDALMRAVSPFICVVSSDLQETLCLESRHSEPGLVPVFCLLLHRLNFMRLVPAPSLIMSLKLISPGGHLASPLGVKIWLEGGSLLWTGLDAGPVLLQGGESTLWPVSSGPRLQASSAPHSCHHGEGVTPREGEADTVNVCKLEWMHIAMFMSPQPGNGGIYLFLVSVC